MERRRVGNGDLLPRVGSRFERQDGDVVELGQFEEGGAPHGGVVCQGLGQVPGGAGGDEEVVVAAVALPDSGGIPVLEESEEVEAVLGAGVVVVGVVEVAEGIEAGVVREEDGVGAAGVGGEAGVVEHAAVEDELEHEGVGAEPGAGLVVGLVAEAVVGEVGAEVVGERVVGAVGEEVEVELWREVADVDPAAGAFRIGILLGVCEGEEEDEGESEDDGFDGHLGKGGERGRGEE